MSKPSDAPSMSFRHRRTPGSHVARMMAAAGCLSLAICVAAGAGADDPVSGGRETPASGIAIPGSIREEHEEIHSTLVEATKATGRVGEAARRLAEVLHPHFVREEEIALPPLGLLASLAAGSTPSESQARETVAMTDALKRELPRMLEEHKAIRAAVAALREAAVAEKAERFERLTGALALHARTEEEVLYPAAILVGEILRCRGAEK